MTNDALSDGLFNLSIHPVINAAGNFTVLGGSIPSERVLRAMTDVSRQFVSIAELQESVHARLARVTRNEAAFVTCGAAAGLYLATLAALSRHYDRSVDQLRRGEVNEASVLVPAGCRSPYDAAVEQVGVRLVSADGIDDLASRVDGSVIAILHSPAGWNSPGTPSVEVVGQVARQHGIPLIVDAAAQVPPKSNLWHFTEGGTDVVALFSGGKGLRGPQASGLIVGNGSLMRFISEIGYPRHGYGRILKVGREQLIGLLAAVEEVVINDEEAQRLWAEKQVAWLISEFETDERLCMHRRFPNIAGQPLPYTEVTVPSGLAAADAIAESLLGGNPRIAVGHIPGHSNFRAGFIVNTLALREGDVEVIARQLSAALDNMTLA